MKQLLFVFFLFFCLAAFSQTPGITSPLVLTHITEENGLSDNHVTCVYKDKEELLWVGTIDGLNLLDGSTIKIFKNNPADTNSICDNYITAITEDKAGTIWIATANGFCSFEKHKRKFVSTQYYGPGKTIIGGISSMAIDNNNSIWIGTGAGLLRYDLSTRKINNYFNSNPQFGTDSRYSNKINKLIVSSDNRIWLSTADGLWFFSSDNNKFTKVIHKQNDRFYHPFCNVVYEDDEKNIWAGFWNTGLKKYNPNTDKLTDYGSQFDHSFSINSIVELHQDNRKLIWVNGALLAFDERSESYFNFPHPVNEKDFPIMRPVYKSPDGWIWLASDNGLYIYNPERQFFSHTLFKSEITSQQVVFADYKNGFLVGAQGSSFLKWENPKGNVIKDFSSLCKKTTAALCIIPDASDDFWIGTTDGILHANLVTNYKKWYQHIDSDSTSIPRNFITSLFIDSRKRLWVFPWREGIWQMDTKTGACKKMLDGFITESGKIKKLLISDAAEDNAGNIWMADLDEGIILYDTKSKRFSKPFEKEIGAKTHTSRIFIRNGVAYSALNNSIIQWNIDSRKLQMFQPPAELNKPIEDICPDKNGNWWLATSSGLIVFNESDKKFRKFSTADGLYENDVVGTLFCTSDSTMVIGAPRYLSLFEPRLLTRINSGKKNIIITEFLSNDKNIEVQSNKTISLGHNSNNIDIHWALPIYGNPLKNQYYYQLVGIDPGWKYIGNKGEVQFANLSPGHYSILLKATTSNETEPANPVSLNFIIRPPYWKTNLFIIVVALTMGILFFIIVRYISQRNLKEKLLRLEKEQAIEKERNRISQDMHDDLGSGLTKIAILSEVVKKQMNEPEKAKQQLENISTSSRELIDNLQDIIWVLNPRNDTLESLTAYIREYGLKFFEPFSIKVRFYYPEKFSFIKLSEETRRNIFLVIKETFNNSCKHAWCNTLEITIEQHVSKITIMIRDDGKGFTPGDTKQFGNGLINMKARIEQIGGSYNIQSIIQKGTVTTITVPLVFI